MLPSILYLTALAGFASALPSRRDDATGVQFAGVNIAGFDFACSTDGYNDLAGATPPLASLGGVDGAGQMKHFVDNDGLNIFRLPVGWQYLLNNKLGGKLDSTKAGKYHELVTACLDTGAHCIIDIHNYARWNGKVIGQDGPTNEQFANLWSQLAKKYANYDNIIFGLMNEPHDLPDVNMWADSLQEAVTAIRNVCPSHLILLPGNNWTAAGAMPSWSGPALLNVTNPDGSVDGLILDVHSYLDEDFTGTRPECNSDNIDNSFRHLAKWLRKNKRMALLTETGGGDTDSCHKYLCNEIDFLNKNADVYLGYVGWAAGAFNPDTYFLSQVPLNENGTWTDVSLVKQCIARSKSS